MEGRGERGGEGEIERRKKEESTMIKSPVPCVVV